MAGDVNGDGLDDLIIGALYADSNGKVDTGKSYIVFGKQDNTAINLSAISSKPSPLTSPALETECPPQSPAQVMSTVMA
jgi:hypothetical protein